MPEGRQVFPELSVIDNLRLGAYAAHGADETQDDRRAARSVSRAQGAAAPARGPPLRRRAANAGDRPRLDGAPRGSDARRAVAWAGAEDFWRTLYDLLAELREEGTTILLVDQMAALALSVADRAYVLQSGRSGIRAPAHEIGRDPALVRAYLGGRTVCDRAHRIRRGSHGSYSQERATAGAEHALTDIGIAGGQDRRDRARSRRPRARRIDLGGRLVSPGFVETHIHLDKSCILDRCKSERATSKRRSQRQQRPRPLSRPRMFMPARSARSKRRSCKAPPICARISKSIPASACADSKACCRCSRNMPGRSTCRSACFRRRVSPTIPAPTN